ncbi:MAG: hypothetical protein JNM36_17930 [Chitinophagales bacterium]|jgi:hypothetical protein|nr:hypothetical protein [Chitinophagales bacterium]
MRQILCHIALGIVCLALVACSATQSTPDLALLTEKNSGTESVLYQFYEKFGFTDICEHYRNLYYCETIATDIGQWKKLPITANDLKLINALSNKIDTLKTTAQSVVIYQYPNFFADIAITQKQFAKMADKCYINTLEGFYSFDKVSYKIYNPKRGIIYEEFHGCQ